MQNRSKQIKDLLNIQTNKNSTRVNLLNNTTTSGGGMWAGPFGPPHCQVCTSRTEQGEQRWNKAASVISVQGAVVTLNLDLEFCPCPIY